MAREKGREMEVCSFFIFFFFSFFIFFFLGGVPVLWDLSINRAHALLVIEQFFF